MVDGGVVDGGVVDGGVVEGGVVDGGMVEGGVVEGGVLEGGAVVVVVVVMVVVVVVVVVVRPDPGARPGLGADVARPEVCPGDWSGSGDPSEREIVCVPAPGLLGAPPGTTPPPLASRATWRGDRPGAEAANGRSGENDLPCVSPAPSVPTIATHAPTMTSAASPSLGAVKRPPRGQILDRSSNALASWSLVTWPRWAR